VAHGTIKTIRLAKLYGFIQPAGGEGEVFFYHAVVKGSFSKLREGDVVEYELDNSPVEGIRLKGPRARRVQKILGGDQ